MAASAVVVLVGSDDRRELLAGGDGVVPVHGETERPLHRIGFFIAMS